MFRFGLTGTNWTGKTATIDRLINEFPNMPIEVVSLSDFVAQCPYPTGENQVLEASDWITKLVAETCEDRSNTIQLFDRTPIDILAFTLYVQDHTGKKSRSLIDKIINLSQSFDVFLYLPISDDWPFGVSPKPGEITFARLIDSYIQKVIADYSFNVIELPWALSERNEILSEYLLGTQTA